MMLTSFVQMSIDIVQFGLFGMDGLGAPLSA